MVMTMGGENMRTYASGVLCLHCFMFSFPLYTLRLRKLNNNEGKECGNVTFQKRIWICHYS